MQAVTGSPVGDLVGYHVRRASAALASDYSRTVETARVRQVLLGILSVIAANPGINQRSVGRALGIQRTNLVALTNEVVDRGWVERSVDRDDRRAFVMNLTEAGHVALANTLGLIRAGCRLGGRRLRMRVARQAAGAICCRTKTGFQ